MKSKYFDDPATAVEVFVETFKQAAADPQIAGIVSQLKQLVYFDYTQDDPLVSFHVDSRGEGIQVAAGAPADRPDVTIITGVDIGHQAWANQLNPVVAMATGRIKSKGSAAALLKLAPVLKLIAPIYKGVLTQKGIAA
ncbi:MAG: SCP2 sterol-binding domain-containing protein [Pseudomonadota bacterium]